MECSIENKSLGLNYIFRMIPKKRNSFNNIVRILLYILYNFILKFKF